MRIRAKSSFSWVSVAALFADSHAFCIAAAADLHVLQALLETALSSQS
jgi:hypothetical protein